MHTQQVAIGTKLASLIFTIHYNIILLYLFQSSAEALASAVLAEVPQQLTEYMTKKGIKPLGK